MNITFPGGGGPDIPDPPPPPPPPPEPPTQVDARREIARRRGAQRTGGQGANIRNVEGRGGQQIIGSVETALKGLIR